MPIASTQELFMHELSEIYDAEHRFVEGQEEMARAASAQNLESAIQQHLEQTREHIRNLEEVFGKLGEEPRRGTNEVAKGLVAEAREGIQEARSDALRDCAIGAAVIKIEHFEMGSYRSLVTGARVMGASEAVDLLSTNMQQEEATARTAEQSAPELFQTALQAEQQEKGLVEKVKDKLTGQ